MWSYRNVLINVFLLFLLVTLLCSLQSTFWRLLFGAVASPLPWLNVMLYLLLFRKPVHAIFLNYSLALVLHAFSAIPLGILLTVIGINTALGSYIRQRFFWPSTRYFVIASFLFTLLFHISLWIASQALEDNSANLNFMTRSLEVVLTMLTAAPIYWVLSILDRLTQIELVPESSGVHE